MPHAQATSTSKKATRTPCRRPWPQSDPCLWPSMLLTCHSSCTSRVNCFQILFEKTLEKVCPEKDKKVKKFFTALCDLRVYISRNLQWTWMQQLRAGPWRPGCGLRQWRQTRLLAGQEQVSVSQNGIIVSTVDIPLYNFTYNMYNRRSYTIAISNIFNKEASCDG